MALQTYALRDVYLVIGSTIVDGYADGDAISVEFPPSFSTQVGAGGATTRSRNNDRTATLTVRLQQKSLSQIGLAATAALDRATGLATVPIVLSDTSGNELFACPQAYLEQRPGMTFAQDSGVREWVFKCIDVVDSSGG